MGHPLRPTRPALVLLACATTLHALSASAAAPPPASPALQAAPPAPTMLHRAAYSRTVERIQRGLNDLVYTAGPEDGLFGGTTATAIRRYQRDFNLTVTGQPSQSLLDHITTRLRSETRPAPRQEEPQASGSSGDASGDASGAGLVLDTQTELRRRGHEVRLSGQLDDATATAIRAYQREHGLLVTGQPSAPLLEHIRSRDTAGGSSEQQGPGTDAIARVQAALNARGYQAGPPDGVMGPSTRAAIRTYQADAGLPITGTVTPALVDRLNATADSGTPAPESDEGNQTEQPAPTWRTVFTDTFDGAGGLAGSGWERVSGDVSVRDGRLLMRVDPPENRNPEELGRDLLKSVLGEALGVQMPASGGEAERAVAVRDAAMGGAFQVSAVIESGGSSGPRNVNLGVYTGRNVASGLRLIYDTSNGGSWRLLRNTGSGLVTLASGGGPALSDGARHTLGWKREADGSMTVTLDGRTVLTTGREPEGAGGGAGESFDGLSVINSGGTWSLHRAEVATLAE
ncbi:peptidoglycan-binding domain-containing protein [Roseospira navarrensis]|uniref:Peptidoglycan binding-like domain-containing protein n=1 Tax=Roseospira navarrensis TaxID=140058 RepID=A0A7X1ZHX6_9PROT|nr:peptidoglycan-binding protein [Roseospira navarrensis]MQX38284.1 hypothetical protein [Roseospira navarrensis]